MAVKAPLRTLVVSQRLIHREPPFSALYEFEDVIEECLGADILCLERPLNDRRLSASRSAYQVSRALGLSERGADRLAFDPIVDTVEQNYDLVICVLTNFFDLYALRQIRGWDKLDVPKVAIVGETWPSYLRLRSAQLEPRETFSHWYVGVEAAVEAAAELVGRRVDFMPMAVDALRFAPVKGDQARPIRVANIGRRETATHESLLSSSSEEAWLYWYDTLGSPKVVDHGAHRVNMARMLNSTSFAITNLAKFDQPSVIEGAREMPWRFFEALAAGAVMVGSASGQGLEGSEMIIDSPLENREIVDLLRDLEADPTALHRRRLAGVSCASRHHDWGHRLRRILDDVGVGSTPALDRRLDDLADRSQNVFEHGPGAD